MTRTATAVRPIGMAIPCARASIEAIDQHGRYTRHCLLQSGHDGICRWSGWQPIAQGDGQ